MRTRDKYSHEHLITTDIIDVSVDDILDSCPLAQATNGGATALVTPYTLDLVIRRRVLDRHTLIAVGDHDVVDPHVRARDVNAVRAADVCAADRQVVNLAVL